MKTEEEAEDVLQEAYIKIWNNAEKYDPKKGRLFTWLINICRNAAFDRLRSKQYKNNKFHVELTNSETMKHQNHFNPDVIDLDNIIKKLAPDLRKIIDLVYFEGYSHSEIATLLDMPLGTVKSKIRRAIQKMRRIF